MLFQGSIKIKEDLLKYLIFFAFFPGYCTLFKPDNSVTVSYSCNENERLLLLNKWCLHWVYSPRIPIRTSFEIQKTEEADGRTHHIKRMWNKIIKTHVVHFCVCLHSQRRQPVVLHWEHIVKMCRDILGHCTDVCIKGVLIMEM